MLQGLKKTLSIVVLVVTLAACGARSGNTVNIASLATVDPLSAVRGFMDGIKSRNVNTMAGLWGTSEGLAAETMDQEELVQRLTVIMTYLAHDEYGVSEETDAVFQTENQRIVTVLMSRGRCVSEVPFTLVLSGSGWLVKGMDLEAVAAPRGSCWR